MLLLFSSLPLFLWYHFFPAWHKGTCVASLSWRPSKFICLSLMAISHCHNTKLPTIDRECLFNHDSSSSSLSPSVWLRLAFMRALLLVCRWPSSCGFTALGLHSRGGWRIVSSHFVLGEVSDGLWKDGSHLSPYWLWRMATCLHSCSDGPRPLFAGAEWDMQLPKRRAGLRFPLPPSHYTLIITWHHRSTDGKTPHKMSNIWM